MRIEQLETMTVFKSGQLERYRELGYNLIACGASRGGTSALGILMAHFGFDIGQRVHPETYEDLDFVECITGQELHKIPSVIRQKSVSNPNWALKLPHALMHLDTFDRICTRPVFLIVIRNPLSIARSLMRHDESFDNSLRSYVRGVQHALDFYVELEKLPRLNAPFILCEYEKITAKPAAFVDDFVTVTGLAADEAEREAAVGLITGSGYRRIEVSPPSSEIVGG